MRARIRGMVGVAVALAIGAAPAHAFDSGPHTDLTRDAMTEEGFGINAADTAVADNWFVDYYWNAGKNPFSGHASFWTEIEAMADAPYIEFWPQEIVNGTNHMHFDSSEDGYPDLSTPLGVEAEWQRLIGVTATSLQQAKLRQDPLDVVTIVGMSLHTVQDFYAHTDWVETDGQLGSLGGPGWSDILHDGSFPTYFDIPRSVRDIKQVYSAVDGIVRVHGKWQTNKNASLADGMNKDWPGRPLYDKAYGTAYFASRQWIEAARGWLGDDALWQRAQRMAKPFGLNWDLKASYDIGKYTGHWQGSGEPCAHVVAYCGGLYGWAGSVFGLRSAIKHYHEDHPPSDARRRFELYAPNYAAVSASPPLGQPPPAQPVSSRDIQLQTRLIKLEVTRMRGYDWGLGDPGPDDADLYVNARMRGQNFASTVIHDHDRFSFPKPYAPFTWIRSVPAGYRHSTPVSTLTVRIRTGNRRGAGTDDNVFLRVGNGLRFSLDKRAYDDFERDDDDTYAVPLDDLTKAGLSRKDITMAQIEKSSDSLGGAWLLRSFTVRLNGQVIASADVNKWLQDNHRVATANVVRDHRTHDIVPIWASLKEDDYLYGDDDDGDVNSLDRNTAVAFGYVPGTDDPPLTYTGGKKYSGRLSMQNGEQGQFQLRLSTLEIVPPPPLPVDPVPTPTPTPIPTPSPSPTPTATPIPTPTPTPTHTPPPNRPDLIITNFSWFSLDVVNQGNAAAGPFAVTASGYPAMNSPGLAAGASQTFYSGQSCFSGDYYATVDPADQVKESDETNNTAFATALC